MITGTCNFLAVIWNVAFVAETSTLKSTSETFVALSLIAATASIFTLLNITQSLD